MVAGGGASVIYSDTICDLGGSSELANYGEYSGAPSESQTFEYAKTILSLMTKEIHPEGKVLIIGGGIANFTNVAATFKVGFSRQYFYDKIILIDSWKYIYVVSGPSLSVEPKVYLLIELESIYSMILLFARLYTTGHCSCSL